ncbi:MAG: signal transduction histidine kinase [Cellvibrionaceae bacterium]|jgi:signal transduction histidine kinase
MPKKLTPNINQLLKKLKLNSDTTPDLDGWHHFLKEVGRSIESDSNTASDKAEKGFTSIQNLIDSPLIQERIEARVTEQTKWLKESLSSSQAYMNALPDMILHVDHQGNIIGFKEFEFLQGQPEALTLLGKKLDALWPKSIASDLEGMLQESINSHQLSTLYVPAPSHFPISNSANMEIRISPAGHKTGLLIVREIDSEQRLLSANTSKAKQTKSSPPEAYGESRLSPADLLALVYALGISNTPAQDLSSYYQHVVETIQTVFGFYHTQFLQPTENEDGLVLVAEAGEGGEKLSATNFQIQQGEGAAGAAAQTKKVQLCDSLKPSWKTISQLPDAKSQLAIPLLSKDTFIGVIDIYSSQASEFLSNEIPTFDIIIGQITVAIELFKSRHEVAMTKRDAARLQQVITREGWQAYRGPDGLKGFWYDQTHAIPIQDTQINTNGANGDLVSLETNMPAVQMTNTMGHLVIRPIEVRGQLIGTLGVQDNSNLPLTSDELYLIDEISIQVSNALDNARLITQTQKRAVELQAVADLSASASTILRQESLLKEVVDLTKQRFGLYHTNLYLLEEDQRTLNLVAASGEVGEKLVKEGWTIDVFTQSSLAGSVVRSRTGVITGDVTTDSNFLHNPYLPNTRSELSVPMIASDKVMGVLSLQSDIPNAFTDEDKQIHLTLATQIAIALQNAKLYEEQLATAEQLRELDHLKTQFLANMSHELRTPLNSIIGFADVLLEGIDGELNERMIEDVTLIRDGGRHLRNLIGDILDQAKIEAGMMELSYSIVKVERIAHEVIAQISSMVRTKPLEIVLDLEKAPEEMQVDRTRLIQILFNLLSNAVKFTDEGQITITMQKEGNYLVTHVQDTGSGISEEDLPIIFEQFQQVGTMQNRKEGGTGLGLPISKNLVELHGGEISVTSEPDVGTTFSFTIPLTRPAKPEVE